MFHSARLKLTAWYILIALCITTLFSVIAYNGFRFEVERGLNRQRTSIVQQLNSNGNFPFSISRRPDSQILEEVRERILGELLSLDFIIILGSAVGGYFLAGRTLKPIQQMMDEQNQFISDASHELRTPLTAAKTSLEVTLRDQKLTLPEAKQALKDNLEEIDKMKNLSDGLLQLTQYGDNNKQQLFENISLQEVVNSAMKSVTSLAKNKHITIEHSIQEVSIKGDKQKLIELFVILLDNAIKYSPENTEVSVKNKLIDSFVLLTVADHGIGIAQKDVRHIFDRFYRADSSRSRTSGYGLGLPIAKSIVAMHNGNISIESELKKSTVVSVKLPCIKSNKKHA